ncbi:histidinol dehydrogenase [Acidaminobacter hydrogenoformans]|uniref:Histidinol dehydrogenase n=1 Tax=Acidaminobacter hydrogenoformans DSM 2784 TaxID=1120920 RepID=A0A1G5RYF6_9FIRM|nr:histidinol dehydrogenase [Acidaminobacter hydrogenoformans]SCZ78878.1 histidinol dehydrogenase [Acidaminobacter hydrogenoformans DSM 2784]
MKLINYTKDMTPASIAAIVRRTTETSGAVRDSVSGIIEDVRARGDAALLEWTEKLDSVRLKSLRVSEEVMKEAISNQVTQEDLRVLRTAVEHLRVYHEKQLEKGYEIQPRPGVSLGQRIVPLRRVGLYIPGGKAAYPSTVLMNAVPAQVAGVPEIVIFTPPAKDGTVNPYVLAAAGILGIEEIYSVGGAQAVAACANGTQTIAPCDKIAGPGNQYVAEAKRQVSGQIAIDMIAGPSEVLVIADATADPELVAADLLAQAEHDERAGLVVLTTDISLPERLKAALDKQLETLPKKEIASVSAANLLVVVCDSLEDACRISDVIAPEHLELMVENPRSLLDKVNYAGSVFLGSYTPEALGDYYAGTNHTLPTNGTARFSSPLGVYDFMTRYSYLEYSKEAFMKEAADVAHFARLEGLDAHAASVTKRRSL